MTSKAQPYVGPPAPMPREDMILRRNRLLEVIPQYEASADVLARKRGKDEASAMREKVKALRARLEAYNDYLGEDD